MRVLAFPPPSLGVSSLDLGRRHIRASGSFFVCVPCRPRKRARREPVDGGAVPRQLPLRQPGHVVPELLQCKNGGSLVRAPRAAIPLPPGKAAALLRAAPRAPRRGGPDWPPGWGREGAARSGARPGRGRD